MGRLGVACLSFFRASSEPCTRCKRSPAVSSYSAWSTCSRQPHHPDTPGKFQNLERPGRAKDVDLPLRAFARFLAAGVALSQVRKDADYLLGGNIGEEHFVPRVSQIDSPRQPKSKPCTREELARKKLKTFGSLLPSFFDAQRGFCLSGDTQLCPFLLLVLSQLLQLYQQVTIWAGSVPVPKAEPIPLHLRSYDGARGVAPELREAQEAPGSFGSWDRTRRALAVPGKELAASGTETAHTAFL